jgi:hypothetical protein
MTSYTRFCFPLFYFRIIRSINILSVENIRSPGLSGYVMQMISLAAENSGASLASKLLLLYVSRFTCFQYTR